MANQFILPSSQTEGRISALLRSALTVLLFAVAIYVVQQLTFLLRFPPFQRATIWIPGGMVFSVLLLTPPRRWWVFYVGLCLGVFGGHYGESGLPAAWVILAVSFHFPASALCVWGLRRFSANRPFGSPSAFLVFAAMALVPIPVMSTVAVDVVRFVTGEDDIWPVFLRSVLGFALGILIATPALTLACTNGRDWFGRGSWRRYLEFGCLAIGMAGVGYFCFEGPAGTTASPAFLYAPLPLLLWAAARFELAGVSWALLVFTIQSTWAAANGRGPLTNQTPAENVLQLQMFLLAIALPLMFLATVIQDRRQAFSALIETEQDVRRQHAELATIYNTAPIGLAFVNTQLRYVTVNESLAEMNGVPVSAHIGRTVREVLPDLADTIEPMYRQVLDSGEPVENVEIQGKLTKPGIERNWLVSRYPVNNNERTVVGVITVVQEITEQKRTEERFRLVVESTPNAIVMANEEGSIILVNSQCETLFGYCREELVGLPVEFLVPERYRANHSGFRMSFFASPSARPMGAGRELFGRRKDGSEFPVEIGLTPIQTGAGLLVLSAIVDITQRKQAEETRWEFAHAARLAMVGELTAFIAHEINQPLGAILSNADAAEILLKSSGPKSLDEVRQILGDISRDVLRASEVIRRLRGLLSKRELELQLLDPNEVTSEVLTLIHAESLRRTVEVKTDFAVDLPAIRGDKLHLQQVLLNLLLNGMDAMAGMPEEKRLTVRTSLNQNGCVAIAVGDAGTGVAPDRLAQLFDPFYTTKKEGMGLGLSIARSIVEAHGGRIWAENNPGGGATFYFTVPVAEPKEPSNTPRTSREAIA